MTKDRLASFRKKANIRGSVDHNATAEPGPLTNGVVIEMEKLGVTELQSILQEVADIKILIDELSDDVSGVILQHKKILSAQTSPQEKKRKDELTNLMSAFKSNSAVIQQKLKIYFVDMTEKEREDESSAAARARRTQYSTLFFLFTQTINDCHSAQLDYLEKEKAKLGRLLKITNSTASVEEVLEQENFSIFTEGLMSETDQAKQKLNQVESARDDILKLETSIIELHKLFIDMTMLVESQGEIIDRIDKNVESAKEYVEASAVVLKKAQALQTSARKKKIWIIIIVIIVLLIVGLIIYLSIPKG